MRANHPRLPALNSADVPNSNLRKLSVAPTRGTFEPPHPPTHEGGKVKFLYKLYPRRYCTFTGALSLKLSTVSAGFSPPRFPVRVAPAVPAAPPASAPI